MSLSGIRDISVLEIPPAERLPVQTYVTEYTEATAADAIMREVSRGGQVFVVYNRVDTIDAFAARLRSILPEGVRIITGHGQQNEALLENVIKTFYDGGAEVLVSTTIIENGIDLARANTLIVYDADKMGLAQLYQLRGRVGRSNRLAYAYFCYRAGSGLSGDSYKRLAAILEHTELGSGFKIAMRDLEIRGAGDVLGREQHGHMEKVGYDLYCKLLSESVAELRGGAVTVERECRVDADLSAYIPAGYIEDEAARMRFYARTAGIRRPSDRETLLREITDIYGAPEKSVVNLVSIGLYKGLGIRAGASHIVMRRASATVTFYELTPKITAALEAAGDGVLKMQAAPTAAFDGANVYERVFAFLMKAAG
jgi:transcription-repair coupling factor (superfamily II helicase)